MVVRGCEDNNSSGGIAAGSGRRCTAATHHDPILHFIPRDQSYIFLIPENSELHPASFQSQAFVFVYMHLYNSQLSDRFYDYLRILCLECQVFTILSQKIKDNLNDSRKIKNWIGKKIINTSGLFPHWTSWFLTLFGSVKKQQLCKNFNGLGIGWKSLVSLWNSWYKRRSDTK